MRILSLLAGFISILLSVHYFYSYRILSKLLEVNHLDYMSIITFEDIAYQFGNLNFMILSISGFGLIWIYLWHLIIMDESKFRNDSKGFINKGLQTMSIWVNKKLNISQKTFFKIVAITVLISLSSICFILIFSNYSLNDSKKMIILFLINFTLIPGIYILFTKKRELVLVLYAGLIFLFGLYMIDNSFVQTGNSKEEIKKEKVIEIISFDYNSQHFVTSQDTLLIFNGYKHLILKINSKNIYDIIPKQEIKNLKKTIKQIN